MKPTHAIIHHSATADSGTVSWGAIRRYHKEQGWNDVGYHIGIELIGDEYEVLIGRPFNMPGAHCKGFNNSSIGICFVGDYDKAPPPDAMMQKAIAVIAPILDLLNIPLMNVQPHSMYAPKTCPGTKFPMMGFVAGLKAKMGG